MKKLFFFAAVALGMIASCQKPNVEVDTDIDDNSPVEVVFGVNAPSITVTKTKAAVDAWNDNEVSIFSGVVKKDDQNNEYTDFTEPLINEAVATVSGNNTGATVTFDNSTVHYYEVDEVYNFYGYYIDDAVKETTVISDDKKTINKVVTIDGSQDIMLATTDKKADLNKATSPVNLDKVYSAYAARRGVQPTLVFEHMLSRFKFKVVKGETVNTNTANVRVTKIGLETYTQGNLQIAPEQTFLPVSGNTLSYIYNDISTAIEPSEDHANPAEGGSDLMVFPGTETINLEIGLTPEDSGLSSHAKTVTVPLVAAEIGDSDKFEAGKQYTVTITVYDLEQIVVTADLTEWGDGGEYTYDSDKDADQGVTMYNTPTTQGVLFHFVETLSVGSRVYADKEMTKAMADGTYTDEDNKIVYVVIDGKVDRLISYFLTETAKGNLYHTTETLASGDNVYTTPEDIASTTDAVEDGLYLSNDVRIYKVSGEKIEKIYNSVVVETDMRLFFEGDEIISEESTLYKYENDALTPVGENKYTTTDVCVYDVDASGLVNTIYYMIQATFNSNPVTLYHTDEKFDLGSKVWEEVDPDLIVADAGDYIVAGQTYTVKNGWVVAVN